MAKPTAQQCHALTTYFSQAYTNKYNSKPLINRNTARWSWVSLLMDMTPDEAKKLIDFYFETFSARPHNLEWFFYNYDSLITEKNSHTKDREEIERLRHESEQRARAWRERGMKSIETERE